MYVCGARFRVSISFLVHIIISNFHLSNNFLSLNTCACLVLLTYFCRYVTHKPFYFYNYLPTLIHKNFVLSKLVFYETYQEQFKTFVIWFLLLLLYYFYISSCNVDRQWPSNIKYVLASHVSLFGDVIIRYVHLVVQVFFFLLQKMSSHYLFLPFFISLVSKLSEPTILASHRIQKQSSKRNAKSCVNIFLTNQESEHEYFSYGYVRCHKMFKMRSHKCQCYISSRFRKQ